MVNLHVHSDFSTLDSLLNIKDYVSKVKANGMTACALTDHGTGAGLVTFYDECKKQGIKPILGCEVYVSPGSRFDRDYEKGERRYHHLILLVKNDTGYKNLCRLITRSNTEGYYYKPRIDEELLKKHCEGLICLSACVAGKIPCEIIAGMDAKAVDTVMQYKEMFGDDFYLEIQNHGIADEELVRNHLRLISQKTGVKLVATNDCHYLNTEDAEAHEWLLCMQTQTTINASDHMKYIGDYSVRTEAEMRALFPDFPEAVDTTDEIAAKCDFSFVYGDYRMPKVVIPEKWRTDYFGYMESEAWKGFEERYPEGNPEREQARKDLEYELSVIKEMKFAEYFLDTRKTIMWARNHGILVGPGRGSAAGSRMCYCLGITDIDPIPYGLMFSRFLNPERISMPDIDVDYDYSHKEEVIASEAESNGKDKFAKIQTFITMQAKAVIKDVTRVAEQPVAVGVQFSKLVGDYGSLKEAYENSKELRDFIASSDTYKKIWSIALKLEGTKKAEGQHACGHIPTPVPCEELFPCSVDKENGYLICQYDMSQAEHLGNLKKDLLMLRNLTVIDTAHQAVKKRTGKVVPLWNAEILNDKDALDMIAQGYTNGVFQLESEGMKRFMKDLKPSGFEDIIAGVALYRPGPMDMIPQYIENKHKPENIKYLTPQLEPILKTTYGIIVYQEQVMQIVQALAGFSQGRADVVRKAMGKKKMDIMMEEKKHFIFGDDSLNIKGCIRNGISQEIAETIYAQMESFASYAFNKSHAAAYAAIAMQTAYLKCHYAAEFYAGLLTSDMDDTEKLSMYAADCKKKGVKISVPAINSSGYGFTVSDSGEVEYGLTSIKKVGSDVVKAIVQERTTNGKFTSIYDFMVRCQMVNSGALENLIKAGAFDFTGYNRPTMIHNISIFQKKIKKAKKNPEQISLFDLGGMPSEPDMEPAEDWSKIEMVMKEKEATGQFISFHPMETIDWNDDRSIQFHSIRKIKKYYDKIGTRQLHTAGIITAIKRIMTKKNDPMAFLTIDDGLESISVVVFPKLYAQVADKLLENTIIALTFKASPNEESLIADAIDFKRFQ